MLWHRQTAEIMGSRFHQSLSSLTFALLLVTSAAVARADDESGGEEAAIELDPIVVAASRIPRPLSEVSAQIAVVAGADIQEILAEDLDGLLRYQPGLEVETSGTRFGITGINIRGVGGNRVAVEIDGVRQRDGFDIGAYSNAGRGLVETDRIKQAEVLFGPASVMYGSNALGGVLTIATWDPSDLRGRSGEPLWGGLRTAYQSADDSRVASAVLAWNEDGQGFLAGLTAREGHELENQAPPELDTDPKDWDTDNGTTPDGDATIPSR